jgi:ribosomal protein S6--L-glutamate ligase
MDITERSIANVRVANGRDPNHKTEERMATGASARGLPRALRLPPADALIPRIGASVTAYGLAVVRQFEAAGVLTTASSRAIARSRDKLQSMQLMSQAGLPIPQTAVLAHPEMLFAAVEAVGGLPVIMKLIQGTQGRGVILARYMSTVVAVLEKVREHQQQILVQEFIGEADGSDVRVIVAGDRCVAAMERSAPTGEFRSNLHRGGTATVVTLDARMAQLAVQAAQVHGLKVAGVDLIRSDRGPLVLEVNSSPGLEGIEQATGVDVAGAIVSLLERKLWKKKGRKRRGQ